MGLGTKNYGGHYNLCILCKCGVTAVMNSLLYMCISRIVRGCEAAVSPAEETQRIGSVKFDLQDREEGFLCPKLYG